MMASVIKSASFIPIYRNLSTNYRTINIVYGIVRSNSYCKLSLGTCITQKTFILPEKFMIKNQSSTVLMVKRYSSLSSPIFGHVRADIQNTDDLDKLFKVLLFEIEHKHMVEKSAVLKILSIIEEKKFIKDIYVDFLIGCCTELLRNESKSERLALTHRVHDVLRNCVQLNISNYNELLRCYIVNGGTVSLDQFIKDINPAKPNWYTYELFLESVCVVGDVKQAEKIIGIMKSKSFKIKEVVYDNLIEAYGKSGDYEKALYIRDDMISSGLNITANTQKALIMAAIYNGKIDDLDEHLSYVTENEFKLSEKHIMDIVKCLAQNNYENLIPNILTYFPKSHIKNVGMSPFVRSACAEIIHMGFPNVAYLIYDLMPFNTDPTQDEDIGKDSRSLLRECIVASVPIDTIKNIISQLIVSRRNVLALEGACQAALKFNRPNIAEELLKDMKKEGKPIRLHYFWPLMVNGALKEGEAGIFHVLSLMKSLDITPDLETFLTYILPNVSLASPEMVVNKFQLHGLTVSLVMPPILFALINTHQLKQAIDLCNTFETRLDCDDLLQPLLSCYLETENFKDVFTILKIITNKSTVTQKDWIGIFLMEFLNKRKPLVNAKLFVRTLEAFLQHEIKISATSADIIFKDLFKLNPTSEEMNRLRRDVMSMIDHSDAIKVDISQPLYKHPNKMTVEELEGHLIELESSNLNTRGILRKLLQRYCQLGNVEGAMRIFEKCNNLKIDFSPGMKANMLNIYMKSGNIEKAEKFWKDLTCLDSNFPIDDYKFLDYATLLTKNKRMDDAYEIIKSCGITGSTHRMKAIEPNCFRLLNATADVGNIKQTEKMLSLLVKLKLCTETNVLLGSLIRVHINRSDIPGAVKMFTYCVNKYKKTPLKVELLSLLLKGCDECGEVPIPLLPELSENLVESENDPNKQKHTQHKNMLQRVIDMDVKVYGSQKSKISLIAALAETGLQKPLKRYLLDTTVQINETELLKQCQRFVKENKVNALELLVSCLDGVKSVDQNTLYEVIMEAYNMNGNCTAALEMWKNIQTNDVEPKQKIAKRLCSILRSHRVQVPSDVLSYASNHRNDSSTSTTALL